MHTLPARPRVSPPARRSESSEPPAAAPGSFEALYQEHAGRVYAICLRMTADPAEAEAAAQDVFVQAWRKLGQLRSPGSALAWLRRIAVSAVCRERRSAARRRARVEVVAEPERVERGFAGPVPEERMELERAIAALPPGARDVLVLHDIEGYRHGEIAALLGISPGTSKSQLHRARMLLREALEP
jgi:RNA polymerase sigma-70 factor, ECF subfamily